MLVLYIISDSLGETGEQVAKSVISQYDLIEYEIKKFMHVSDKTTLTSIINEAKYEKSIVIYTLVDKDLSDHLELLCEIQRIPAIDILNPLLNAIAYRTNLIPLREPGINRRLDESYFQRVEAIEFAVKYDDGKDPRGLLKADLVLIGVSRTSKTPVSMYLANKNIKVANLPLVPEVTPPKELFMVPANRVVGLTNSPEVLNAVRQERLHSMGLNTDANYASLERIIAELEYADQIMKQIGCPVINVANKAIEETATLILKLISE